MFGLQVAERIVLPGEEVSLTKFGAEQYNKIDEADSPAYRCEPHGPTRMMSQRLLHHDFPE